MTTTATTTRGRRKPRADAYDELSDALDLLARVIKTTRNRKLLPIFERLERELDALDDDDAIMARAMRRGRKSKRGH